MLYNICVRYSQVAKSWRVVAIHKSIDPKQSVKITLDRENWWVVVPSYINARNGTWICPRKLLDTFWKQRNNAHLNEDEAFQLDYSSRLHRPANTQSNVIGVLEQSY
jgi:hypothetical protein